MHLQAALSAMKPFGRIPLCGMISTYNAVTPPPGPSNLMLMVAKRSPRGQGRRDWLDGARCARPAMTSPSIDR